MPANDVPSTAEYARFLADLKKRIGAARVAAYRKVNRELIGLYWEIGKGIVDRQERLGWGKGVVERLSSDLRKEFPGTSGFSANNLWRMRSFFLEYKDLPNLARLVQEIPWGQNITIFQRVKDHEQREYYLRATAEMGWSRNVLIHQIDAGAYQRHLASPKQHTFDRALPVHLAEQADLAMKDSYALDFLGITKPVMERELERRMVERIRDVLLELGAGFSFLGNQFRVRLEDNEFFIDLLFFHRPLRCLVAVDLKAGEFKPEYAGKMNFYLNLLDDKVRLPHENPSIGIILCKTRDRLIVEYALRGVDKPMGVAEYYLTRDLPENLAKQLPSPEEIEARIEEEIGRDWEGQGETGLGEKP